MKADLSKTASATRMRFLMEPSRDPVSELEVTTPTDSAEEDIELAELEVGESLEAASGGRKTIRVVVSKAESFRTRIGYDTDFLKGWHIPLPEPRGKRKNDMRPLRRGGTGVVLRYEHFSTVQSIERRMPMFVAVNIDGTTERRITRTSIPWRFDGRLDLSDQIGDEVYSERKNVLDRGHMVRREDPNWGDMATARRANVDTFHFTNSCPQIGAVNQQVWLGLENYVLRNTRDHDMRVSVFTGPVFTKHDLLYRGALVPRSFWKMLAVVDEDGRPSATGYEISQDEALSDLEFAFGAYKTYQVSIRSIEKKTALSFGALVKYDGFSMAEESAHHPRRVRLDSLEMVQV